MARVRIQIELTVSDGRADNNEAEVIASVYEMLDDPCWRKVVWAMMPDGETEIYICTDEPVKVTNIE